MAKHNPFSGGTRGVSGFHGIPSVKCYLTSIKCAYDSTYTEPHQNLNNGSHCICAHSVDSCTRESLHNQPITQHMHTRAPPHTVEPPKKGHTLLNAF